MNRLNELMKERLLTNEELSFRTKIGVNTISKLRNENFNCKIYTILRLADYFNISIDYFLGRNSKNFDIEKLIKIINDDIRRCYYDNF